MPLTAPELVLRATRKARAGLSPSESRIYDDNAYLLIKDALSELATRAARNSEKRPLLMRAFTLTFVDGVALLTGGSFDGLARDLIRWSLLYDPNDPAQRFPYQFRHHLADLQRNLNSAFGYWGLRDSATIATRAREVAGESALITLNGTGVLRAVYIPDFSGSNPLPAGGEFDDTAVDILAEMLVANRPAPAKK
jgi:hypothetical protein